ncbi:MAG: PIG-L family deacetylase, partial [Thiopseudomonas sp.]
MSQRKQQLLRRHRKQKRMAMAVVLVTLALLAVWLGWWLLPCSLLLLWIAHEAWLADHIFYLPTEDYRYDFPPDAPVFELVLQGGCLKLAEEDLLTEDYTLIARVRLRSSWLGRLLDPAVRVGDDCQTFERGTCGTRYLNLTGQLDGLRKGLPVRPRFCRMDPQVRLLAFPAPQWQDKRIMILAPHADDAELAAFGLYSQAQDVSIITLTRGEIEAGHYRKMGLESAVAARLKGRLRSWDSMAIPLWGGVRQENCVQLGYFCLQLPAMREQPQKAFGSRESGETDIRNARCWNSLPLPGDTDGVSSWNNLVADLVGCLEHFRPEVVILPHPQLDPHADHIATTQAYTEAAAKAGHAADFLLYYANHLHDNDRWPMGDAGTGVALPPSMEPLPALAPFSLCL